MTQLLCAYLSPSILSLTDAALGSLQPCLLVFWSLLSHTMECLHFTCKPSLYTHDVCTRTHILLTVRQTWFLPVAPPPLQPLPRQEGSTVSVLIFPFQTIIATSFWADFPCHPCISFHPAINCHCNVCWPPSLQPFLAVLHGKASPSSYALSLSLCRETSPLIIYSFLRLESPSFSLVFSSLLINTLWSLLITEDKQILCSSLLQTLPVVVNVPVLPSWANFSKD